MKAIETIYNSHRFRSRLEASWAAFFDIMRWEWDYEPIDLDGWIPDFAIRTTGVPIYVEVKPISWPAGDDFDAIVGATDVPELHKIKSLGREVLILGVGVPHQSQWQHTRFGVLFDGAAVGTYEMIRDIAIISKDDKNRNDFCGELGSYHHRISGYYDGNQLTHEYRDGEITSAWANARNRTQWKGA